MEKSENQNKWYKSVFVICILSAATIGVLPWIGTIGVADTKTAEAGGLWINFLGQYHPMFLHLPIGATALVLCMELLGLISRGKYKPNTTLALAFAAGTAIFAVVLGYFLYLTDGWSGENIEEHKRDGVIFGVVIILTFLVKFSHDVKQLNWLKPTYYLALFATAVMLYNAGHKGGVISHGDPLKELPSKIIAEREADKVAKQNAPVITDPVIYTNIVHNILQNKCISCHGEDKVRGDLRLDSMAHILAGGADEEALVKGDVEGSYMLTTISLPMDDDMHMPPKEQKEQITPEELKVLTWWVKMGAPDKTKLSEVDVPDDILAAIKTLKTPAELEAERKKLKEQLAAAKKSFMNKRENQKVSVKLVNESFPGSLRYTSQQDTDLVFNSVSYRKQFKGSDLKLLESVADSIAGLDIASTNFTNDDVAYLAQFKNLRNLKLNETKITDEALKTIGKLENLRSLNLYGTEVSDKGLEFISSLKHIEKVYLWNTKVTPKGASSFRKALVEAMDSSGKVKRPAPIVELGLNSVSIK